MSDPVADARARTKPFQVDSSAAVARSDDAVDLDGDGAVETFVSLGGGSGGSLYAVYVPIERCLRWVGFFEGYGPYLLASKHAGFSDVEAFWQSGVGNEHWRRYVFDGVQYRVVAERFCGELADGRPIDRCTAWR